MVNADLEVGELPTFTNKLDIWDRRLWCNMKLYICTSSLQCQWKPCWCSDGRLFYISTSSVLTDKTLPQQGFVNHLWTNGACWLTQSTLEPELACKRRWGSCCLRGRSSWDYSRCCCSEPTVAHWKTRRRGRREPRRWWRCSRSPRKGKWGSL